MAKNKPLSFEKSIPILLPYYTAYSGYCQYICAIGYPKVCVGFLLSKRMTREWAKQKTIAFMTTAFANNWLLHFTIAKLEIGYLRAVPGGEAKFIRIDFHYKQRHIAFLNRCIDFKLFVE